MRTQTESESLFSLAPSNGGSVETVEDRKDETADSAHTLADWPLDVQDALGCKDPVGLCELPPCPAPAQRSQSIGEHPPPPDSILLGISYRSIGPAKFYRTGQVWQGKRSLAAERSVPLPPVQPAPSILVTAVIERTSIML